MKIKIILLMCMLLLSGCDGKISCREIDKGDFNRVDDDCYKNILNTCNDLIYELDLCDPMIAEKDSYIKFLECEADIYGDTWRESDCGVQISREQEEFPCER